jgi:peptidoglycan/xylan/chitin deacetylase (PgdA/CDA1 family)
LASASVERVRSTLRPRAQRVLKRAAGAYDGLRPHTAGVVILAYHRVGGRSDAGEIDLPAGRFERQIETLATRHHVLTLDAALDALRSPSAGSTGQVVVTFDDGTADFVDVALPILVRHRVPATLYIATDFVERGRSFPDGGTPLSWPAVRDALATGLVTLGSHTHTHALFDRVDPATAADELRRSTGLLAERAGVRAEHFAYPKALAGPAPVERVVRETFRSAAVAGTRANAYGRTDPWRLARSPVQRADGMRFFEQKVSGGLRLEDDVRRLVNRVRYLGATS